MRTICLALLSVAMSCAPVSEGKESNEKGNVKDTTTVKHTLRSEPEIPPPPRLRLDTLRLLAEEALVFNRQNNLDTTMCILIDMWRHPGTERLFVWSLVKDTIVKSGLVSHGSCNEYRDDWRPVFKNVHESHCSSLGKYKTGARVYSTFGVGFSYKLHGLEPTNNRAYDRLIVFHSWAETPDEEVYPEEILNSWGCPAVSDKFMLDIDKDLKKLDKPVLLWIFD